MTAISPPAWMQGGSYPARTDRLSVISGFSSYSGDSVDESTPMRVRQGIKPSYQNYQLKVRATPTASMNVIVSGGFAVIDNRDAAGYGAYACANDADVQLAIGAADATRYRLDTVIATVADAETSGSVNSWSLAVVPGPLSATQGGAVRGTLPNSRIILADILVRPAVTSIAASDITDQRVYTVASGGVLPVTANTTPNHLAPGQVVYLQDSDRFQYGTLAGTTKDLLPDTGWVDLAYPTGYERYNTNSTAFQIRKIGSRVSLRGRLRYSASLNASPTYIPTGLTTLPGLTLATTYRPAGASTSYAETMVTTSSNSANPPGLMRAQVFGSGQISVQVHTTMTAMDWLGFGEMSGWYTD